MSPGFSCSTLPSRPFATWLLLARWQHWSTQCGPLNSYNCPSLIPYPPPMPTFSMRSTTLLASLLTWPKYQAWFMESRVPNLSILLSKHQMVTTFFAFFPVDNFLDIWMMTRESPSTITSNHLDLETKLRPCKNPSNSVVLFVSKLLDPCYNFRIAPVESLQTSPNPAMPGFPLDAPSKLIL